MAEPSPLLPDCCPVCGSTQLQEIRCKVICLNCRTILQSCADLGGAG
jgi:DNA polymerase II large subunit